MRLSQLTAVLVFVVSATATALSYQVQANEKACFYTHIAHPPLKVAFYFAVQYGGSFDIDYTVTGPVGNEIIRGERERQADYVFTAQLEGDYAFCFNNEMSTFAEKMVDFEIMVRGLFSSSFLSSFLFSPFLKTRAILVRVFTTATSSLLTLLLLPFSSPPQVENEERVALPSKAGTSPEQASALESAVNRLSGHLAAISRTQKYFRTRENRNSATVTSTERRVSRFSMAECAIMMGMAGLQVFVVRFFFQGARKGMSSVVLLCCFVALDFGGFSGCWRLF